MRKCVAALVRLTAMLIVSLIPTSHFIAAAELGPDGSESKESESKESESKESESKVNQESGPKNLGPKNLGPKSLGLKSLTPHPRQRLREIIPSEKPLSELSRILSGPERLGSRSGNVFLATKFHSCCGACLRLTSKAIRSIVPV